MLPSIGIIISHYKDPYYPTSTIECHKDFDHCSHVKTRLVTFRVETFTGCGDQW